jgi:glycosyltransferase involved in cell wall biosynthesis
MDGKTQVSVVVSFLNAERFLAEAIESVFSQTFKSWELLLVDDGSTDNSTKIARGYAAKYPQTVRYLEHYRHRRRGQGASRNLGIRNATGEYIATLDHDDVWLPNKLERQVAILDSHPEAAMVYGATQYWRSWAGDASGLEADYVQLPGVPTNRIYEPPDLLKLTLSEQIIPPIPTDVMFRKESICNLGGFEESFIGALSMFEDQAFLVKVYTSLPVFVSGECWDRYRIHPNQHCARVIRSGKKPDTEYFFLSWVSEYLEFQGPLDAEIKSIVSRRMWPHNHRFLERLKRFSERMAAKAKRVILHRRD